MVESCSGTVPSCVRLLAYAASSASCALLAAAPVHPLCAVWLGLQHMAGCALVPALGGRQQELALLACGPGTGVGGRSWAAQHRLPSVGQPEGAGLARTGGAAWELFGAAPFAAACQDCLQPGGVPLRAAVEAFAGQLLPRCGPAVCVLAGVAQPSGAAPMVVWVSQLRPGRSFRWGLVVMLALARVWPCPGVCLAAEHIWSAWSWLHACWRGPRSPAPLGVWRGLSYSWPAGLLCLLAAAACLSLLPGTVVGTWVDGVGARGTAIELPLRKLLAPSGMSP